MIVLKNVLVATDFGEAATVAFKYGRELARTFGATLHVIHVVDDLALPAVGFPEYAPDYGRMHVEAEAAARNRMDALVSEEDRRALGAQGVVVASPQPARAILDYARNANVDAIVLGTRARGHVAEFFMGGVGESVLRLARCPVLVVRYPEHEFVHPDGLQTVTHA